MTCIPQLCVCQSVTDRHFNQQTEQNGETSFERDAICHLRCVSVTDYQTLQAMLRAVRHQYRQQLAEFRRPSIGYVIHAKVMIAFNKT